MRPRPPFALVLVGFAAVLGLVIALTSGGSGPRHDPDGRVPVSGPAWVCVTARAEAAADATRTVRAPVSATVPVSVTVRAKGVAATASEEVVQRAIATRTLEARRGAVAKRRACARGATRDGARSKALTRAYRKALATARADARAAATRAVEAFAARDLPSLISSAQAQLDARADAAAAADRKTLAAQARARLP